jgi:hypothetical protein
MVTAWHPYLRTHRRVWSPWRRTYLWIPKVTVWTSEIHRVPWWCPVGFHVAAERLLLRFYLEVPVRFHCLTSITHFLRGILCGYSLREILSFIRRTHA